MNKLSEIILKHAKAIFNLLIIVGVLLGLYWVYQTFYEYYVFVRFKELGPLTKNMAAYYKGFVIGKVTNIGPDDDYKASIVKVVINNENTRLPSNTFVVVQKFPDGQNYLEFIYPDKPALRLMQKGDVLEGIANYSLEQFMHGQTRWGVTDVVSEYTLKALDSADETNREIRMFFKEASEILRENRQSIKQTAQNTEKMTESLAKAAENLNKTSQNFIEISQNIKTTTTDINNSTKGMDKTTNKISSILSQIQATATNLNKITAGLLQVLSKRFAGMRIMFGKPLSDDNIQNNCRKP